MINQELLKIGLKIRNFRLRAGLSQLELEGKIEAAPGSLSRIESGQVNTSKETLVKIVEALDLVTYDAATLFNLDTTEELNRIVKLTKKLNSSLELNKVLENISNEVAKELKLHGVSIFLLEGNDLVAKTFTNSWYTNLALKVISQPFGSLRISLDKTDNYFVKSVLEKRPFYSKNFNDFSRHMLTERVGNLLQKVTNTQSIIVLPVLNEDKAIGVVLFAKNYVDDFSQELNALKAFTDTIAIAIINAQKYSKLQEEIVKLKND